MKTNPITQAMSHFSNAKSEYANRGDELLAAEYECAREIVKNDQEWHKKYEELTNLLYRYANYVAETLSSNLYANSIRATAQELEAMAEKLYE